VASECPDEVKTTDIKRRRRYGALRRYAGGILATVGIFAMSFGTARVSGSGAVSLTLLILGLVSLVSGVKLRGHRA
jgi:hypothetical protein